MRKRYTSILIWLAVSVYLFVALGFATDRYSNTLCNTINVTVLDSVNYCFVNPEDIVTLLQENNLDILGKPLSMINLKNIEEIVLSERVLENAAVYITAEGVLNVDVRQRNPMVRIENLHGQDYFLDNSGNIINVSGRFSPHVLIANGSIYEPFDIDTVRNIFDAVRNYPANDDDIYYDLFELAGFITSDEFWNAQIVQLYWNEKDEFELIPRVGSHIILLGDITDYKTKLENLKLLYREGFSRMGWNNYIIINLKFRNQIVCTKI